MVRDSPSGQVEAEEAQPSSCVKNKKLEGGLLLELLVLKGCFCSVHAYTVLPPAD